MDDPSSERPLSILHLILGLTPTNGQYNEHCLPLMHSRNITICTYFKSEIAPPAQITLFDGDSTLPGFFRALRAALKATEYDVIHVHTPHAGVLLIIGLLLCGRLRADRQSSVHTVQNSFQSFSLRNKLLFLPSFAFFHRLVFCSHASYHSFPGYMKKLAGDRTLVVQNAVDLDRIDRVVGEAAAADGRFTVVTVGLIDIKNPLTVLAAFRDDEAESGDLVFLGEGHLRPSVTRKAAEWTLEDRVTLKGMVERNRVFEHFSSADLFVSASRGEGLPVAVLEAMACSCPVVLSDIQPHREIAERVDFIPLIEPDDVEGFRRAIARFRKMPRAERQAIGRECRRIVEERFSLPVMHAALAEVYGEIAGRPLPVHLNGAR